MFLGLPCTVWGLPWVATLLAGGCDICTRRIPNALTFPLFLAGLGWSVWAGGLGGLGEALLAAVMVASPYLFLFVFGGGGAGDAKMMGALGAWLGLWNGLLLLLAVLIAGAVGGVVYALVTRQAGPALGRMGRVLVGLLMLVTPMRRSAKPFVLAAQGTGIPMPYGVAIFAGTCLAALCSNWWSGLYETLP